MANIQESTLQQYKEYIDENPDKFGKFIVGQKQNVSLVPTYPTQIAMAQAYLDDKEYQNPIGFSNYQMDDRAQLVPIQLNDKIRNRIPHNLQAAATQALTFIYGDDYLVSRKAFYKSLKELNKDVDPIVNVEVKKMKITATNIRIQDGMMGGIHKKQGHLAVDQYRLPHVMCCQFNKYYVKTFSTFNGKIHVKMPIGKSFGITACYVDINILNDIQNFYRDKNKTVERYRELFMKVIRINNFQDKKNVSGKTVAQRLAELTEGDNWRKLLKFSFKVIDFTKTMYRSILRYSLKFKQYCANRNARGSIAEFNHIMGSLQQARKYFKQILAENKVVKYKFSRAGKGSSKVLKLNAIYQNITPVQTGNRIVASTVRNSKAKRAYIEKTKASVLKNIIARTSMITKGYIAKVAQVDNAGNINDIVPYFQNDQRPQQAVVNRMVAEDQDDNVYN